MAMVEKDVLELISMLDRGMPKSDGESPARIDVKRFCQIVRTDEAFEALARLTLQQLRAFNELDARPEDILSGDPLTQALVESMCQFVPREVLPRADEIVEEIPGDALKHFRWREILENANRHKLTAVTNLLLADVYAVDRFLAIRFIGTEFYDSFRFVTGPSLSFGSFEALVVARGSIDFLNPEVIKDLRGTYMWVARLAWLDEAKRSTLGVLHDPVALRAWVRGDWMPIVQSLSSDVSTGCD